MSKLVIYHSGCWDGFCAAWLLHKEFPDAEFIPANYGDDPPDVSGKDVYVVDFSYPREDLLRMHADSASLIVLDHHKTAKDALKGLPFCIFDMDKSGGRLTHEYIDRAIHGITSGIATTPNWLVAYTEDRDLWRWELDESRAVSAALRSHPLDFDLWDSFAKIDDLSPMIAEGKAIMRAENQTVEAKVSQSHIVNVQRPDDDEYWWPSWKVANATTLVSETAGKLAEETGVGCCWFEMPSGDRVYSLRAVADSNVDVSLMAKAFGGGGHPKAAGFKMNLHPWGGA